MEKINAKDIPAVEPTAAEATYILAAIEALKKEGTKYINTVYSGLNEVFRKKFPGRNPVAVTKGLQLKGIIDVRPIKGGALLYKKGDMKSHNVEEAEAKIDAYLKNNTKTILRKKATDSKPAEAKEEIVDPTLADLFPETFKK